MMDLSFDFQAIDCRVALKGSNKGETTAMTQQQSYGSNNVATTCEVKRRKNTRAPTKPGTRGAARHFLRPT